MNFLKYHVLFIVISALLVGQSELSLEQSYKYLSENAISSERRYELANSALEFGLFENAAEIYESLLITEVIGSPNIKKKSFIFP